MKKKRIAILAPDLSVLNGVSVVAKFLYEIINSSETFSADLISIATSARDVSSVRLLSPQSWMKGVRVENGNFQGIPFRHIGANLTEIEFFRYRPRKRLSEALKDYDLVQVVAGLPMWVLAADNFPGKIALQVATLSRIERESMIAEAPQPKRGWMRVMLGINQRLESRAFARSDAIFVENRWLETLLEKKYPEKVIFAPPGVNTDFFRPADSAMESNYILSVGRFHDRRKNVQMLFRAYKILLEKLGEKCPRLVLAGQTAPTENDLAFAESIKIRKRIDIFTSVSEEKLRELYQNAGLFVLSSNEEGFGIVIAEAMACGLAVVATKCGGPEVLIEEGKNGFLVSINDYAQMAEKIAGMLENAEMRNQFEFNARKIAEEKFSRAATEKKFLGTYECLLK